MHRIWFLSGVVIALGLGGCASVNCGNPHAYYKVTAQPALKAPSGLSVPPADPAYAIPGETPATGQATDRTATGGCLIAPPNVIAPAVQANPKPATAPAASSHAAPAVAGGQGIG